MTTADRGHTLLCRFFLRAGGPYVLTPWSPACSTPSCCTWRRRMVLTRSWKRFTRRVWRDTAAARTLRVCWVSNSANQSKSRTLLALSAPPASLVAAWCDGWRSSEHWCLWRRELGCLHLLGIVLSDEHRVTSPLLLPLLVISQPLQRAADDAQRLAL